MTGSHRSPVLEQHPHPELKLAATLLGSVQAEVAAGQVGFGSEPVHVIEQVVSLRAELDGESFRDMKILKQRGIDVFLTLAAKDVATEAAELRPCRIVGEDGRHGCAECRRI